VRTALSLGRDRKEIARARLAGTRLSELLPMVWTVHDDTLMRAEASEERSRGYPSH
jgi:hypothetical protein